MTQAEIWEGFETGRGPFFRLLRLVMIAVGIVALFFFGSLSLSWPQQAVLGLLIERGDIDPDFKDNVLFMATWMEK